MKPFVKQFLKNPLLHFLAAGSLLFLLNPPWPNEIRKPVVVITPAQVRSLYRDLTLRRGVQPNGKQMEAAISDKITEEILFQEALDQGLDKNHPGVRHRMISLAKFLDENSSSNEETLFQRALQLGLHHRDTVVRRQLAEKMRIIAEKVPTQKITNQISQEEMQKYLQRNSKRFLRPPRFSFTHVFINQNAQRGGTEKAAQGLLSRLQREKIKPRDAPSLGKAFLRGHHFQKKSPQDLAGIFGPDFVKSYTYWEEGKWIGPFRSSYGWHLIWIHQVLTSGPPPLAEIQNQVIHGIRLERRKQRFQERLRQWRKRYLVEVQIPPEIKKLIQGGKGSV